MSTVTFPAVAGGATYTDDSDVTTGLANGGHKTRFIPALKAVVDTAADVVVKSSAASASAAAAAASAAYINGVAGGGTAAALAGSATQDFAAKTLTATTVNANNIGEIVQQQGIVTTYAASGSTGIQIANNYNLNFGTGDFTLVWKGSLPDWTPAVASYLFWSNAGVVGNYNGFQFVVFPSGNIAVTLYTADAGTLYSATPPIFANDTIHTILCVITRESAGAAGSVTFYADGAYCGVSAITAKAPATVTNNTSKLVAGHSSLRSPATTHSAYAYNRALSADEVLSLHKYGVAESDKWGSQIVPKSGCVLALEPEGIQPAPGQWLDSSTNKLHALQPASGSSLARKKENFEIRWTNTWAGTHEAQYVGGINQAVLPPNCYIESIIGVVSGTTIEDIILGDGVDTDRWVTITTGLATGTQTFAIANRVSDGTNRKLVVDPDANFTGSISWVIKGIIL